MKYTKKEYKKYVKSFDSPFCKKKGWKPISFRKWKKIQPEADSVTRELRR